MMRRERDHSKMHYLRIDPFPCAKETKFVKSSMKQARNIHVTGTGKSNVKKSIQKLLCWFEGSLFSQTPLFEVCKKIYNAEAKNVRVFFCSKRGG